MSAPVGYQSMLDYTMSMLQARSAMHDALGIYAVACDKDIANKASYKAMGLDPRSAPEFGWGLQMRPGVNISNTEVAPQPQPVVVTPPQPTVVPAPQPVIVQPPAPVVQQPAPQVVDTTKGVSPWMVAGAAILGLALGAGALYLANKQKEQPKVTTQADVQTRMNTTQGTIRVGMGWFQH